MDGVIGTEGERKDPPSSPLPVHSMCTAVAAGGESYSQNPFYGGGEPLPVTDFQLPERPPAPSGSASECRMAVMHPAAGKGGAWAAGCQQEPPW